MRGFSIIEMIIVLAVITILGGIATLNFNRMNRKAEAERQLRYLHADLFSAKIRSVQQSRRHAIIFGPKSYSFVGYSTEDGSEESGTVLASRKLTYNVCKASGKTLTGSRIDFDNRGLSSSMDTIRLAEGGLSESLNCIAVSRGRINIGKMKNDDCIAQ